MEKSRRQRFHCTWNSLTLWGLVENHHIIHLSFDLARHQAAMDDATLAQLAAAGQQRLCALLPATLHRQTPFAVLAKTPFIQQGTPFQKRVWQAISTIPFGATRTYGELAAQLGNGRLARAVGQACNKNPLPLLIPCHRVVGSTGLGGFNDGVMVKKILLEYEHGEGGEVGKLRS